MTNLSELSRRERQIMDIVYASDGATVHSICEQLEGSPTPMAVRRMLAILMEKGHLIRSKEGREFLYRAKQSKVKTGVKAFRHVVETFFAGSIGEALANHMERPGSGLSEQDVEKLNRIIDEFQSRKKRSEE